MNNLIIGRQQIINRESGIYAYELLFRDRNLNLIDSHESTVATQEVITGSILEIGLNNIVGQHKAFVNFTTQNILEKTPLHLPKERVVIDLLENVDVDDNRILSNLRELSRKGYSIAIDGDIVTQKNQMLLDYADIIRLDVFKMEENRIKDIIPQLKFYDVKVLASKVETIGQYEYLAELGCDYFQGFFLNKPDVVKGKRLGVDQMTMLRLLLILNESEVRFDDLVKEISQDVSLTHKILRYINSAYYPISTPIKSISHAIAYLGLNELKRWVGIVMLSSLSHKPNFVIQNALVRGRMCETLAKRISQHATKYDEFFFIGILSALDSILEIPIEEVFEQLTLSEHITDAVLHRKGFKGEILDCVLNYETGNFKKITTFSDLSVVSRAYLDTLCWVKEVYDI